MYCVCVFVRAVARKVQVLLHFNTKFDIFKTLKSLFLKEYRDYSFKSLTNKRSSIDIYDLHNHSVLYIGGELQNVSCI